jgi:hypothetical protein
MKGKFCFSKVAWIGMLGCAFVNAPLVFAIPSSIDSDIVVYSDPDDQPQYHAIDGRLRLKLKAGSSTQYEGTLLDYNGHQSYLASASVLNPKYPVLHLTGAAGSFTIVSDTDYGDFGSAYYVGAAAHVPAGFPKNSSGPLPAYFAALAHSSSSAQISFTLAQRSGLPSGKNALVSASATINYDAHSRISGGTVHSVDGNGGRHNDPITWTGYYSPSYFYLNCRVVGIPFDLEAYVTTGAFTGPAHSGAGGTARLWYLSGVVTQ